jgi:hypothetical protein
MRFERQTDAGFEPLELDPPAYTPPTLPPPPPPRRRTRWVAPALLGALSLFAAIDVVAGPQFLTALAGSAAGMSAEPKVVTVRQGESTGVLHLDRIREAFPESSVGETCPASRQQAPLVLYSSITAAGAGPAEARWMPRTLHVNDSFVMTSVRRVAVLRTRELVEPAGAASGRYEGTLVVFDAATSKPLCNTVIRAAGAGADELGPAIRKALAQGAARLDVSLDI